MPVYTYRCENCGVQFERHQSFSDAPLKTCPECRKKTTRIIFKGSGFYATDHKSSSGSAAKKAAKEEAPPKKEDNKAVKEESKVSPAKTETSG
jgi:putative FmdB family regulatory protein